MPSAPACSRLMSSRFSTSRVSRSSDSSAVASSSSRSASLKATSLAAQAVDRRLGRGQRGAQVVADRGQQRGAQPVGLGQRPDRGGLLGQPLLPQRDRGLGGEGLDHPPVGGGERVSAQDQGEVVVDRDRRRRPRRASGTAGRRPRRRPARRPGRAADVRAGGRVGSALQQGHAGEAERLAELVEQRGQRPAAAQHAAGEGGQCLGLGAGARPLRGCAGRRGRP